MSHNFGSPTCDCAECERLRNVERQRTALTRAVEHSDKLRAAHRAKVDAVARRLNRLGISYTTNARGFFSLSPESLNELLNANDKE